MPGIRLSRTEFLTLPLLAYVPPGVLSGKLAPPDPATALTENCQPGLSPTF